jgi:hypothetical protein
MEEQNILYVVVGERCPPCNLQKSVIDNMGLTIEVAYVDAAEAGDLISEYALRSTPSMILNGAVLRTFTPEDELNEFIGEHYKG